MIKRILRLATHPAIKAIYLVTLLIVTVFYLVNWGRNLPDLVREVNPASIVAALVVTYLSSLLYSYIQYVIYRRLGTQPPFWTVFRIVTISQLGKYLPGKVLFAGNYYLFSREAGIGNLHIGASFAISIALWMLTASLCGVPALGLLQPELRYSVLILPLLLALLIQPRVLGWLFKLARQATGRVLTPASAAAQADLLAELDTAFYLRVALLYLGTWALAGLGAYCCLAAFVPLAMVDYSLVLASIALGTVAGFLVLFAPVGLGVREGIGALVLTPIVGADAALLSLLLVRGVAVAVDLSLAVVSMAMGIQRRAQ